MLGIALVALFYFIEVASHDEEEPNIRKRLAYEEGDEPLPLKQAS